MGVRVTPPRPMKFQEDDFRGTKEEAIERARILRNWKGDPSDKIMVQRDWCPIWFAHFVAGTFCEWIAYEEIS